MLHYSTWSHWRLSCRRRRNSLCQTNSGRSTFSRQGFCWHISTITVVVRKWPFTRVDHFHFIIWQDTSGILQWSWHHLHRWSTNNQVTPQLRYPNVKPSPKLAINLKPIHHQISPNHHHTNFKTIFLTQTNFTVIQTTQAFSPWFSPCKIYHQKLSHQHQNPTTKLLITRAFQTTTFTKYNTSPKLKTTKHFQENTTLQQHSHLQAKHHQHSFDGHSQSPVWVSTKQEWENLEVT